MIKSNEMKIIIVGAGDVGHYLCQILSEDGHSVTLIESSDVTADEVEENLDVRVIRGNGASAKCISMAGADSCDFFMAMTAHDQLNIVACSIAHKLGAKTTIARVHDQTYSDNSIVNYQKYFDINVLINPEALTAIDLAKHIRNPERVAIEDFARGQIELQELIVTENAKVLGKPLKELALGAGIKICYLERRESLLVPTANTVLQAGDKITIIGTPEILLAKRPLFSTENNSSSVRIVLYGATETAVSIIRRLSNYRFKLRVIEPNLRKCKEVAENFPNVTVINGSATSLRLLEEEQIGSADYFIACTKDDEENVMTCLQAKKLGVKHVELVINKPDYEQVLQNISGFLNIEAASSPRRVTASEIQKLVTDKNFIVIGALRGSPIEFIELEVAENCPAQGKQIYELNLPPACIIAAIVGDDGAKVPGAKDVINVGERLVIILERTNVREVAALFCDIGR